MHQKIQCPQILVTDHRGKSTGCQPNWYQVCQQRFAPVHLCHWGVRRCHYLKTKEIRHFILKTTEKYFKSKELVEKVSNYQVFLNKEKIESLGFTVNEVAQKITDEVINFDGIYKAVTARTMQTTNFTSGILNSLQNGYNQKFSGDVMMIPNPATLMRGRTGTSHGSGYSYDTHVPIIFYGNGIRQGSSTKRYNITDIAPTIANLLKIEAPNGTSGIVIDEVLKK